ncbi:MAG TPA: TIGR03790 family protein [Bryobacteraceae bacterium]|nr:TIGR03790 family protein [Bryobacteraceae bacterium]
MHRFALLFGAAVLLSGQTAENVLLVVNQDSIVSRNIGEYYVLKRHVPLANICRIKTTPFESISRGDFDRDIARPIAACLQAKKLEEKVLYIVTTLEVPLRILSTSATVNDGASVDSELTLLYAQMHGRNHTLPGSIPNPFFNRSDAPFRHPDFPIYLVTRLAAYDFAEVAHLIDRALAAKNRGKFVIDLRADNNTPGNDWLRAAARALPKDRVLLEETKAVVYNQRDVIGYASWGSNDPDRKQRFLGFQWFPGAIMTEFVSTNGRTFARPPDNWNIGNWADKATWFAGGPQTMTADYIHEGVTGASGHVDEPYLAFTPRPDILLPAYYRGRNLAESYYLSIPALSWMNIVVGDPLCSLGKP